MTQFALAYTFAVVAFLALADAGALAPLGDYVHAVPALDKLVHFVMYGLLALLANAALVSRQRCWTVFRAVATGSLIVAVASTLEEISNLYISARHWSLGDLAANYLGILFLGVVPFIRWPQPVLE